MNHWLSVEQANEVKPLLNAYFKSSAIDRPEAYNKLMSKLCQLTSVDPSDEKGVKALKGQFLSRPLQDSIRPLQDSLEPSSKAESRPSSLQDDLELSCSIESHPEEDSVIIIKRNNLVVCEEDVGYQDAQRQSILNVWSWYTHDWCFSHLLLHVIFPCMGYSRFNHKQICFDGVLGLWSTVYCHGV